MIADSPGDYFNENYMNAIPNGNLLYLQISIFLNSFKLNTANEH